MADRFHYNFISSVRRMAKNLVSVIYMHRFQVFISFIRIDLSNASDYLELLQSLTYRYILVFNLNHQIFEVFIASTSFLYHL